MNYNESIESIPDVWLSLVSTIMTTMHNKHTIDCRESETRRKHEIHNSQYQVTSIESWPRTARWYDDNNGHVYVGGNFNRKVSKSTRG